MFEDLLDLLLPYIAIIAGIIGLAYGINKLLKSKDDESSVLKYLALGTSIVIGLVNLWAIYEWTLDDIFNPDSPVTMVHWLTILLIFLAGTSMLAEPLKNTPIAAVIAVIAFGALAGLFLFYADFSEGISDPQVLGDFNIPLWLVILLIVVIVGILFVVTWFTEFTIDRMLQLISWAPIVIIFCGLLTIQGLLMVISGEAGGIWYYISG